MSLIGHAQIGSGTAADTDAIAALLREHGEASDGPDFWLRTYQHLGVDDAREIRERAGLRPVAASRRVFVIIASHITTEAQNALLKVFEEPPASALFVVLVPSPLSLLPTLRSRAQRLELDAVRGDRTDASAFLKAAPHTRLDMLKPLLEKDKDDARDIGAILAFLTALETALAPDIKKNGVSEGVHALYATRSFIADRGALIKPLLEQLAFTLPVI